MRVSPRTRRMLTALLLPLLVLIASVVSASPATAGDVDTPKKAVGVGVNRLVAVVSWSDNRPATGTGRPYRLSLWDETPGDCSSSRVASVWVRRIQAGTENILASGVLTNWSPCSGNSQWWLESDSALLYHVQRVSGRWDLSYNLWSGPGGSPSPTNKQELRIYLFDSSGHQVDGTVGYPYPG